MTNIAVTGAAGRMGKILIEAIASTQAVELSAAIERPGSGLIDVDSGELAGLGKNGIAVKSSLADLADSFDVLIDFTQSVGSISDFDFTFFTRHDWLFWPCRYSTST